ncbi:MAG TPA: NAD(P)H-dependent oxidoreductase subunit E, partial [Gallionellaceae bacterium]|nr:NAD(P)H-dependent oxidoreductase subunit E [Gallionellaceae bacterium]
MVADTDMHASYLTPILARYRSDASNLLQILREAQEHYGYIHPDAIACLSAQLNIPRVKIEGVATFYSFLHLQPQGEYRVLFSDNITDHMLGSAGLLKQMCEQLWVEPGKVSEDGLVSVDITSCTGLCDQGPAMLVNNIAINRLTPGRIDTLCALIRQRVPLNKWPAEFFVIEDNIRRKDILLDSDYQPGAALAALLARGTVETLQEIRASKLRGRGGAGFSTGTKWESCRAAHGAHHYVVCNADEGEPGTFKDRVLLTGYADQVFEGMTLCARIIGARRGFLYLRGEYRYLLEHLQTVLERRREQRLLGTSILGCADFDFDIEIHLGAGAYVCGEESALIESLEGKRGTPRNRPPFPVTNGYLDQPTVVNN